MAGALPIALYENDRRVATVGFDYGCLDEAEDFFREAIAAGRPLGPLIEGMVSAYVCEVRCELVVQLVSMLVRKEKKALAVYALADACGLGNVLGLSQTEMARRLGVTKQDVQNMSEEFSKFLGLRQTRTHRGEEAKRRMVLANHRPTKKYES